MRSILKGLYDLKKSALPAGSNRVLLLLFFVVQGLSGCSVNDFGVTQKTSASFSGGYFREVSATGVHFEARWNTFSVSIGRFQLSTVHMNQPCSSILASDSPETMRPTLRFERILGAQIMGSKEEFSILFGYAERLRRQIVDREEGFMQAVMLDYRSIKESKIENESSAECF